MIRMGTGCRSWSGWDKTEARTAAYAGALPSCSTVISSVPNARELTHLNAEGLTHPVPTEQLMEG